MIDHARIFAELRDEVGAARAGEIVATIEQMVQAVRTLAPAAAPPPALPTPPTPQPESEPEPEPPRAARPHPPDYPRAGVQRVKRYYWNRHDPICGQIADWLDLGKSFEEISTWTGLSVAQLKYGVFNEYVRPKRWERDDAAQIRAYKGVLTKLEQKKAAVDTAADTVAEPPPVPELPLADPLADPALH